jgi:hypothetical protein
MARVLHNKALHQTRRVGAAASRPVVEARLAGEGRCCTGLGMAEQMETLTWSH